MVKIFTSLDPLAVGRVEALLEQRGIEYLIRNQYLSGALGELPATECWPEVWISRDEDYGEAMRILELATGPVADAGPWVCPSCGEANGGAFASCWHCGANRV